MTGNITQHVKAAFFIVTFFIKAEVNPLTHRSFFYNLKERRGNTFPFIRVF